jgi:protein-tyrosine phosphatase
LTGKDVYIGCQGGWGRTGLFLALLAKTCGVENPIMYVRQNYARTAVETPAQEKYVRDFDVTPTRIWLFWYAWTGRIGNAMFWWRR